MRTFNLAGVAVAPSVVCLGVPMHGTEIRQDESFRLLDLFFELGGTFFDTAHVYASWLPTGTGASERALGNWIVSRGLRDKVVIGTKGAHPPLANMAQHRVSPTDIGSDINDSLERLQTSVIDLYWLHRDAPDVPVSEILGALNDEIGKGRIRAIGASNCWPSSATI